MARQNGIIKLKGTIGDISFYKTGDGHLAREKGGIDASRIANDPAFQRTRENGAEFGTAGKGIVLGATSNTDANTLDDYEEGTWTPSLQVAPSGVSIQSGSVVANYTKIGNRVCISMVMNLASSNNPPSAIQILAS